MRPRLRPRVYFTLTRQQEYLCRDPDRDPGLRCRFWFTFGQIGVTVGQVWVTVGHKMKLEKAIKISSVGFRRQTGLKEIKFATSEDFWLI